MKKVTLLSEEALRLMYGKVAGEGEEGSGVGVEGDAEGIQENLDAGDSSENAAEVDTEGSSEDNQEGPTAEATTEDGEEDPTAEEKLTEVEASLAELKGKFDSDLAEKVATAEAEAKEEAKEKIEALDDQLKTYEADVTSLKEIVAEQIGTMRLALSMAEVDTKEWSATDVVKEFKSTSKAFAKALPVGSLTGQPSNTVDKVAPTRADMSAYNTFKF